MTKIHWTTLLQVIGLLGFIILLIVGNIILWVRRKRSPFINGLQWFSLGPILSLFCLFLSISSLHLSLGKYFLYLALLFFFVSVLFLIVYMTKLIVSSHRQRDTFSLPPDLYSIFQALDDFLLIQDSNKAILLVNHKENVDLISKLAHPLSIQSSTLEYNGEDYMIETNPLVTNKNIPYGTLIILHQISAEKAIHREIEEKNKVLTTLNEQLVDYIQTVRDIESERERLQILEQIQEVLLEQIQSQIHFIASLEESTNKELSIKTQATQLSSQLGTIYQQIRTTVNELHQPNSHNQGKD